MEIVWIYETDGYANLRFFSKSMGTQQRLPNGNTYIADSANFWLRKIADPAKACAFNKSK